MRTPGASRRRRGSPRRPRTATAGTLGAQHVASGTATVQSLRQAIQPGLYLKPWEHLTVTEILIYRAIYEAMLSTARRITARTRVAA